MYRNWHGLALCAFRYCCIPRMTPATPYSAYLEDCTRRPRSHFHIRLGFRLYKSATPSLFGEVEFV